MEPVTPRQTPRQASEQTPGDTRPGDTRPGDTRPGDTRPGNPGDEEPTDLHIRVDPAELSATSLPLADDELLAPGTMLGEYRVEGLIGKGGMGFVYAAVHPLIGKRAAVKVLRRELCRDPLMVDRFIDEARIVNQIGHPNIVDVFAFGQTMDGRSYFVMEWLKGETLRARVARSPLPVDEIRGIVRSLASALSAVHAHGVIHRDLKPDNVFLVAVPGHGTAVKLLDFGVAKLASASHRIEQTASGALIGTPQYIAPEQAKSPAIDRRADTYAFGAILFELITGRPPFVAGSAMEVVAMHLMEPPPRPSELATVPPEIDDLVVAMLAKSPDERPALDEVAAVLERTRWPERPSVPRARPRAAARPQAARRRRRTLVLIASGLGGGGVIALALALFVVRDDRRAGFEAAPADSDARGDAGAASTAPVTADSRGGAPAAAPVAPAPPFAPAAATTEPSDASAGRKRDGAAPGPVPVSAPGPGPEASGSSTRGKPARPKPPGPRSAAADAAPATRRLRLVVEAPDFVAKIDGKRVGAQAELAPGTHRLRVCARGKRPYEREIEIKASDVTWRVELEPLRDQDLQCRE